MPDPASVVKIRLEGVTRTVPAGDYNHLITLSNFLFKLTDVKTPDKKAARWALDRAVVLLSQLRSEADRVV